MKRVLFTAMAATVLLTAPPGAMAGSERDGDHDDLVVITGGATVAEDQSFHDVVVFDGPVSIEGEVRDTLVVFHGDVTVSGTVGEDVVVFDGDTTIASGASVGGDLATLRDPVVEEGAVVEGEQRRPSKDFFTPLEVFAARVAFWVATSVSYLILGLLLLLLVPRAADAIAATWQGSRGSSVLWGLILLVGLPIGAVLTMITIVGLPLGFGILFALGLLYSIGYVAGAWALGRTIVRAPSSRWAAFMAGLAILRGLAFVPVLGWIVGTAATVVGLGLVGVTLWRARRAPAPAAA